MKNIAILLLCIAAAGCNTTPINQLSYGEQMQLANKIDAICKRYGVKPNTKNYNDCFRQEVFAEQARRDEWKRRGDNFTKSLNEYNRNQVIQNSQMRPLVVY